MICIMQTIIGDFTLAVWRYLDLQCVQEEGKMKLSLAITMKCERFLILVWERCWLYELFLCSSRRGLTQAMLKVSASL